MNREVKKIHKQLRRLYPDIEITTTRNGHYKVKRPGSETVFMPSTPSDSRSLNNLRSQLRRSGYEVD